MRRSASTGERIWRAIALGLFVVLAWQLGNAVLAPPMAAPVVDEPINEFNEAPLLEPPASAARPRPASDEAPGPTPTVLVTHEAIPAPPAAVRIGNTGGIGAYLRATPRLADRLRAWPDGTVLIPTGQEAEAEGRPWRQVVDPDGGVGWIPAAYLVP